MQKIIRNFLEINSLNDLVEKKKPIGTEKINLKLTTDFQSNKFLYKQIGKKFNWTDRILWSDQDWIKYINKSNLFTYILKVSGNIVGFFELIYHEDKSEIEIAYLGLLAEYTGKKLGGYLLSEAIKISWKFKINRIWVHTCSLDHKNALNNYLSRGMKIFDTKIIKKNTA